MDSSHSAVPIWLSLNELMKYAHSIGSCFYFRYNADSGLTTELLMRFHIVEHPT